MFDLIVSTVCRLYFVLFRALEKLFVAPEESLRLPNRVEAMYRRRYAGRRLAGLRVEVRTCWAGLVLFRRRLPRPLRLMLDCLFLFMLLAPLVDIGVGLVMGAVRRRKTATGLKAILDTINADPLLNRLQAYRPVGRQGYPLDALWRAYLSSFVLNLPSTNALVRLLEDDAVLRRVCGFRELPHRTTFNRFISRLAHHHDLVEGCLSDVTERMRESCPDLGRKVAIDSTTVPSWSNPNKVSKRTGQCSDPEASWTAKTVSRGKDQRTEYFWGYKLHSVVDATYGVPLGGYVTTASQHDSPELPDLLDATRAALPWVRPTYVIADKGYDARSNHAAVSQRSGVLICKTRASPRKTGLYEGIYTPEGVPTCLGMVPMEHVRSDPERGHLYRCRREGCRLKTRKGVRYCDDEVWENRSDDPRLFGPLRQASNEWKALYEQRQAVERVFKSLKQSRRLDRHCVRRLLNVSLHAAMSVLTYSATVLTNLLTGNPDARWQVRRVT